jgi:hypothetical protein
VRVAEFEPERAKEVEARVHASEDRQMQSGRGGKVAVAVLSDVVAIVGEEVVNDAHRPILRNPVAPLAAPATID